MILISFCIPTNGIVEWVGPVLKSIYEQGVDQELFEVVISDNGNDNNLMNYINLEYKGVKNLIYKKTKAVGFENQIEAFKMASGEFIKFVNHRMILKPNTVKFYIDYVNNNINIKPISYFSNGKLGFNEKNFECFEKYIRALSYWSSWSAGVAMWKQDFDKMILSKKRVFDNSLFPHLALLFSYTDDDRMYIINNNELFSEIEADYSNRGKYNLFYAFAVEYPSEILKLVRENIISITTFQQLKKEIRWYCSKLYLDFIIQKKKCSFDLCDYNKYLGVYFKKYEILLDCCKVIKHKIKKLLR